MAEYIEREALMKFPIRRDHYDRKNGNEHFINGIESVLDYAENLPSADVAPVRHGCTVPAEQPKKVLLDRKCGICDSLMLSTDVYCPNCGTRMDLEEPNEAKESRQP